MKSDIWRAYGAHAEIAQRLRDAVGEILDDYTDDDVFGHGVD